MFIQRVWGVGVGWGWWGFGGGGLLRLEVAECQLVQCWGHVLLAYLLPGTNYSGGLAAWLDKMCACLVWEDLYSIKLPFMSCLCVYGVCVCRLPVEGVHVL